jgi:hypothetical protein
MLSRSFVAAPKVRDIKVPPASESNRFLKEKISPVILLVNVGDQRSLCVVNDQLVGNPKRKV